MMDNLRHGIDDVQNKSYNRNKFNLNWCTDVRFAQWIQPVENDDKKAFCIMCEFQLQARLNNLLKHADSERHKDRMELFFNRGSEILTKKQRKLRAELKITAYLVFRQKPFMDCNYFVRLLRQLFDKESDTIKTMTLCRKKATNLVKYVLAPAHCDRLSNILKNQKFSAIIDESTDRSMEEFMGIEVRYEDEQMEQINSSLWDLVPVYDDENTLADADTLCKKFKNSFEQKGVPLENLISFCSDTTNLLFGQNNSVTSNLKTENSHILLVKCNCHLGHLCAKKATDDDPLECEKFVKKVYKYIKGSSKRSKYWITCQKKIGLKPLTVKKPIDIRWSS